MLTWTRHDDGTLTADRYSVQRAHKGGYHATPADEDGTTIDTSEVYATKHEAKAWAEGHAARGESDRRRLAAALCLDATQEHAPLIHWQGEPDQALAVGGDGGASVVTGEEVSF